MSENTITYDKDGNATTFVGPEAVNVFAMAVLASGLRLYAKTGMLPNRAYTPKRMMAAALSYLGGQKFKARDYIGAADALSAKVQAEKERIAEASTVHGYRSDGQCSEMEHSTSEGKDCARNCTQRQSHGGPHTFGGWHLL